MTTNNEICTDALRKIGVVAQDETATADEMETARRALGRMLLAWQNKGYNLWAVADMSVALSGSATFALVPRPFALQSVLFRRAGIDMPMMELNRVEYDRLPNKASTGTPTCYYYNRQANSGTLYIWPLIASATTETLEITYIRSLDLIDLDEDTDFPPEWDDAVVYGLAARLMDDFSVNMPNVPVRAELELMNALSGDREGSVYFIGDSYQ